MAYERKLVQVGNSLGVTLPPEVLKELGIKAGDWLKLEVEGGTSCLVITKSDLRERTKEHGKAWMTVGKNEVRQHQATLTARKK